MTEIRAFGSTYVGTAEGDHGVFTNSDGAVFAGQIAGDHGVFIDNSDFDVFAGQIAGDHPRVGVHTWPNGTTSFVECDADGWSHGRALDCRAGGGTAYGRYEHGFVEESADLCADGTCWYNGEACRADYAPFVALQAMVVPIKARPAPVPPQPPLCRIRFHRPPIGPSAIVFATRRS